jgi:hypothetical protein
MKTISGPSGLPDSARTISTPSGVITVVSRRSAETASIGFNHPGETDTIFRYPAGLAWPRKKSIFD